MALMGVHYCVEPPEYARAWDATKRILARLREEVDAYGAKLVVVSVSPLEEVSLEYVKAVKTVAAHPERLCLEKAPGQARLSGILAELDIEQVSLLSDFRRAGRDEELDLYMSDRHWNARGHALAAEIVVFELLAHGLLPGSDQAETH
jgi:hypothetical protein